MQGGCLFTWTVLLTTHPAFGQLIINSPTTVWTPIRYSTTNQYDYSNDEQTGRAESDLVGTFRQPALYVQYNGSPASSNGTLAFRARVGSDLPQAGTFDSVLFVGIDGNSDGKLDLFVGADNSGGSPQIKIWATGPGLNISPNTTTINAPANQKTYAGGSANFDFSAVSLTLDPGATNLDLNADGATDRFVSFSLPFADIVSELSRLAGISINTNTILHYVEGTSTQANSLNEDLNGVPKNYDGTLTWQQLGAYSDPVAASAPEPGVCALAGLGLAALGGRTLLGRRRAWFG